MTANIKRSFTSTIINVHNYRFTNDWFAYITRTVRFTNTEWFGMITNTIYDMNILIAYSDGLACKDLQMTSLLTLRVQSDLPTLNGLV